MSGFGRAAWGWTLVVLGALLLLLALLASLGSLIPYLYAFALAPSAFNFGQAIGGLLVVGVLAAIGWMTIKAGRRRTRNVRVDD